MAAIKRRSFLGALGMWVAWMYAKPALAVTHAPLALPLTPTPRILGRPSDFFDLSYVMGKTASGRWIRRHALRCRWCLAPTTAVDDVDPAQHGQHEPLCRMQALIARWTQEGDSDAVVAEYGAMTAELSRYDSRTRPDDAR
jgi:hypothetical protein